MLRAEQTMRKELAKTSLADLALRLDAKMPAAFAAEIKTWFGSRIGQRIVAKTTSARAKRTSTVPSRKR
jgi:hypothetical protein